MPYSTVNFDIRPGSTNADWTLVSTNPLFLRIQNRDGVKWNLACTASGVPVQGVSASGTITFAGQPSAADVVNVAGVTYTFVASGAVFPQVDIGASATLSRDNLLAAILTSGLVAASGASGGLVIGLGALVEGTAGNAIVLTKTAINITITGAGTLTGGVTATGFLTYDPKNSEISYGFQQQWPAATTSLWYVRVPQEKSQQGLVQFSVIRDQ
jgi:hypothetical protein